MPVTPALGNLRENSCVFEASLGYMVSSRPTWATAIKNNNPKQPIERLGDSSVGKVFGIQA